MLSSAKRYGNSSLVHAASSAITAAAMIAIISNDKKKEDIIRSQSRSRLSQKMNTNTTYCSCEGMSTYSRRNNTLRRLGKTSSRVTLESRYKVDWDNPLGEGGYGAVYLCTDRDTGVQRALKMIPKQYTDDAAFQKEMDALLHIRQSGGHPNICVLKENFEQRGNYYLVLDLINGGEMFDHLISNGTYSEADAARLVKETASALAFLHGTGLVHADMKPENLMLSTPNTSDSVVKLVDFGTCEFYKDSAHKKSQRESVYNTPAYSPPESFGSYRGPVQPSYDMFSVGIIIYIMLTGKHPFDLDGNSTDEEIADRIKNECPPLRHSDVTAHLSDYAIDLLEKLLYKRPRWRMTAMQMLEDDWVKGTTAATAKILSDEKLKVFRKFKSGIELKVFEGLVQGSLNPTKVKQGLIERAFKSFDVNKKGYINTNDINESGGDDISIKSESLSLSDFSDLLSDHMQNKYYKQGYRIYKQGSKGDAVYFINSGTVEVSTKAGFKTTLSRGDIFGEGALLDAKGRRNATITCKTPVQVIRISKDFFIKYMKDSGSDVNLSLQEQDRARARDRAVNILSNQKGLIQRDLTKGDVLFKFGDEGQSLFVVKKGELGITGQTGKHILNILEGQITGERSIIMNRPRNATATCNTNVCKLIEVPSKQFYKAYKSSDPIKKSLREISLRRDFQNSVVSKYGKDFDSSLVELRMLFDSKESGEIGLAEIKELIQEIYPNLSDNDPLFDEVLECLDVDHNKSISWEEFIKIFKE